jgi:hypothetical protein
MSRDCSDSRYSHYEQSGWRGFGRVMFHRRNGCERRQSTTGQLLVIGLLSLWLGTHVTGLITRYLSPLAAGIAAVEDDSGNLYAERGCLYDIAV